jgi:hypothetical protein
MYSISHEKVVEHSGVPMEFHKNSDTMQEKHYVYLLSEDVTYPWDPAIVKAIHSFDPDAIPATVKRTYRLPTGGTAVFRYYALLRRTTTPHSKHAPFRTHVGHMGGIAPNIEDLIFEDAKPPGTPDGWPGAFMPMTWDLYYRAKRAFYLGQRSAKQIAEDIRAARQKAQELQWKALHDELDYRWDHDEPYFTRLAQQIASPELAQIGHRARREKKPIVFLGR